MNDIEAGCKVTAFAFRVAIAWSWVRLALVKLKFHRWCSRVVSIGAENRRFVSIDNHTWFHFGDGVTHSHNGLTDCERLWLDEI